MLSTLCVPLPLPSKLSVTPRPCDQAPRNAVDHVPFDERVNALAFTCTLPAVKVLIFPAVPDNAEFPVNENVRGAQTTGAGLTFTEQLNVPALASLSLTVTVYDAVPLAVGVPEIVPVLDML